MAAPEPKPLEKGMVLLGTWQLGDKLGEGAFGQVYAGTHSVASSY